MIIKGSTNVGMQRTTNQDSFFAEKIKDIYLAVICDGMGGANGGNVASETAVKVFVSTFEELLEISSDYRSILLTAVARANDEVYAMSKQKTELKGMGTTMVACVYKDGKVHIINVGDSRLYLVDAKKLSIKQVTKDHSLVQDLIEKGTLTPKEAENYPNKNIITRALGIDDIVDVDICDHLYKNEMILLCSDGLYNYVSNADLLKIVSAYQDIDFCINELIRTANENGGGDNITAVVMRADD